MKIEYYKEFSHELNRDMEFKVFGERGKPCLVFPPQNGRFYDYENFGMVEEIKEYIEAGKIQLFCCDSIDNETWSDEQGEPRYRIEQHERWFHYIVDELVPRIHVLSNYDKINEKGIMCTGCSMGGYHAFNFFLRKPEIFDTVIAQSGIFEASYFFKDYHDELTYRNSPVDYLPNMEDNNSNLQLYRNAEIILSCGRGSWEQDMETSLNKLATILERKGIDVWVDYWGFDVSHDWIWWRKQLVYFLQFAL